MQSIVNGLIWVVAFKENSDWGSKIEYVQYLLDGYAKDIETSNPQLYKKASDWIDRHFIFLDVENIELAIKVTDGLIKNGVNVHALLVDPVNSFSFGYKDTGNIYQDGVYSSKIIQDWVMKNVSIYVSQHPTIKAQREKDMVSPFDAEHGFWNNKADFTWTVNRTQGSNENIIGIHNVREKLTGGQPTDSDEPLIIEWFPTRVNIIKAHQRHDNAIQELMRIHNPLDMKEGFYKKQQIIPKLDLDEAFGDEF